MIADQIMTDLKQDKIDVLDHVAVIVQDLSMSQDAFKRLGFCLTPVSQHSGALTAGGEVVQWGCANTCVMLEQGYLELMGIVDENLYDNKIPEFLSRYEGIHILAFGCQNANSVSNRLISTGFKTNGIYSLSRALDTPKGQRTAKFELVRLPPGDMPEGRVLAIKHLTRDYLWQDRYMEHPNGALALEELVISVENLPTVSKRYTRYFGIKPVNKEGSWHFKLREGTFVLTTSGLLFENYGINAPSNPFAAIIKIKSRNLFKTRKILNQNSVKFKETNNGIQVPGSEASGATIIFIE